MSSFVSQYTQLPIPRSTLFHSPPDTVPQTDELVQLQKELLEFKEKSIERAKKAGDDIRAIEESMRRLKEKEKGKMKAIQKAERERGPTPSVNGDEGRGSTQPPSQPPKHRPAAIPPPQSSPTPSFVEVRKFEELKKNKNKKKRKRLEGDDSDLEPDPPKIRKASPLPVHTPSHPPPPPKPSKYPSTSIAFSKPSNAPDFALPTSVPLLPARPPAAPRPVAGPSKQSEVTEDFSKTKAPNQVQATTFYTSIEPWLRPIKEEDIGFLELSLDEVEPFVMPKIGRHYTQVWGEEDTQNYGAPLPGTAATRPIAHAGPSHPLPKWEPSTLAEPDLLTEERGHGPLTERVVSALIPMHDATEWKGVKAAEEAMEGRPGTNGAAAAAARDKLNVADLEERMKGVMRHHGLLDQIPDYSEAVDDPIATALRHAQLELRTVLATNKARRLRLMAIADARLGYQEFVDTRDSIDKGIQMLYTKLQKKDGPKVSKKKKPHHHQKNASDGGGGGAATGIAALPPCPAALGLNPDEQNALNVPEQLNALVRTRQGWVNEFGGMCDKRQREHPGWLWGFPPESVFQGVDEEVRAMLARTTPAPAATVAVAPPAINGFAHANGRANGAAPRTSFGFGAKGKGRAGDEMDLG